MHKKIHGQGKSVRKKGDSGSTEDIKASTGLPPQVDGQVRCFCKLSVSQVVWTIPQPPELALVRVKWWGEEGDGVLFRPVDTKKSNKAEYLTTTRYPVRSGPCQFATYLNDMGSLTLDLLTSPGSEVIGQAVISQIGMLTNTRPINGFFPVTSATGQKLANLQVSIMLEPLLASYDKMGSVPTTDVNMEHSKRTDDSLVVPARSHPLPYSKLPERPDNTVFISPSSVNGHRGNQGVIDDHHSHLDTGHLGIVADNNHQGHPETGTVAITTNGDVVKLPDKTGTGSANGKLLSKTTNGSILRNGGKRSPQKNKSLAEKDILSVLVEKGTKLREAMIVSSMHADINTNHPNIVGGALTESPRINKFSSIPLVDVVSSPGVIDDLVQPSRYDLDLWASPVRGHDMQLYNLLNELSPGTSASSDVGYDPMLSDLDDPLHENSVLYELYYHNSDNEGVGFSDMTVPDIHHQSLRDHQLLSLPARLPGGSGFDNPLEDTGNQRPPSRTSSLTSLNMTEVAYADDGTGKKKKKRTTKRRARSQSRSSSRSRSRSQTRSRSTTPRRSELTPKKSNVKAVTSDPVKSSPNQVSARVKTRARSRSSSRSRSRSRKRKSHNREQLNSGAVEVDRTRQDGLSVERLTLLGRVHIARVNIESLQLLNPESLDTSDTRLATSKLKVGKLLKSQKLKKRCTYFVEYQFPVSAPREKLLSSTVGTEVTRIASKSIKEGVVTFNHRSVFPVLFDGAAVERWWKSALVFRLYCKEAGQRSPVLIGSGGISLKSILRSDSLFVQREIEIPDTRNNSQFNSSQNSSFSSSVSARSSGSLFGTMKVSVELASDHKEFATIMARTRLAEMSDSVKVVPIGGLPPEKAKLLEQLDKNKDVLVIKSPMKKIDIPGTSSQSTAVVGLPPQSPRRKTVESPPAEEGDEISRLKQQLRLTLAALNSSDAQKRQAASASGQREVEQTPLHTLLLIQEARNITLQGIPPLHMANKYPALLQPQPEGGGHESVTRNTYLVCRMFWCDEAVHSDICWGTLDPEYRFLQVAPVLVTTSLLERMKNNYMIVEVWDKKVASSSDKLIGMVKLSLHQFYLSFREPKIANALLKSEYPVIAIDNYIPIVDPFSGLHFGQLKVVLAMGSEMQIANLQRLALDTTGMEPVSSKSASHLDRQDLLKGVGSVNASGRSVEHQFEIVIEGLRGLKLFESMIWGEADCFVQFFFPAQGEHRDDRATVSVKSLPTMKCFRTATTLCIPDPTFHDTSRHKLTLPVGIPVQRELLTACANSVGGVSGLPFEVWCRYYHPNVRDQLIAKCTLPLTKLCALITMHKSNEPSVQSFSLRLTQVGVDGRNDDAETAAKSRDAGILDVTLSYKSQAVVPGSTVTVANRNTAGTQVCLSVGVLRATGLKAAADSIAQLDPTMAYPADVGVNAYVRVKISFLGKENERMTKTVARSFSPEFNHHIEFPCQLVMPQTLSQNVTSLAELLESAEAVFELWHQTSTGYSKDFGLVNSQTGPSVHKLAHQTGDVLLGTTVVSLNSLLTRRTGLTGWFAVSLPSQGWEKPAGDRDFHGTTALDQVVGGMELSLKFAHTEDRDSVIAAARSVGWSPLDVDAEQPDWQDDDSGHNVHEIVVGVDQVSLPLSAALSTGQSELDPQAKCYVRYKFYDRGSVASKCRKLRVCNNVTVTSSICHKHKFTLSHTAPLQWYLREEKLEIQAWLTYGHRRDGEKKPRQRDKLVGSCYIDLESLTNLRCRQQRISGLFPLFKPGTSSLKAAFIRAHIISRVGSSHVDQASETEKTINQSEISVSASETDQFSDVYQLSSEEFTIDKSPKKHKGSNQDIKTSFGVVVAIERAMHLPTVTDRNRSGDISPTTYVSFQSAERSRPTCSPIFPNSCNPVWDYTIETRLSSEYFYKETKNLVLKVWHKPSDAPKNPDKSCDRVLGFVSVDLFPLTKGLRQICGWYHIMDFTGQCKGQIKVSITPLDLGSIQPSVHTSDSSLLMPSFTSRASLSENTQAVASSIARQLVSLQQQVLQRMGSLTAQSLASDAAGGSSVARTIQEEKEEERVVKGPASASSVTSSHWQPKFVLNNTTDDLSKAYLFSSLRQQLEDLDKITQRLKNRLTAPAQDDDVAPIQVSSARSGDILTSTQSDLSTIHASSVLMNTREISEPGQYAFSFEVGTSQESARSHTMNNSSGLENGADSARRLEENITSNGRKMIDSGIFSAKNLSERSGAETSHYQSNEDIITQDTSSVLPSLSGIIPREAAPLGTLEARFLSVAVPNAQTILSTVDNSEKSGNSRGFFPQTQQSDLTESFTRELSHVVTVPGGGANDDVGGILNVGDSVKAGERINEKKAEPEDYNSDDDDEEGHENGRYGNYHRYREMLDAEGSDDEEEEEDGEEEEKSAADDEEEKEDVVQIVPRSLNNMSVLLSLGANSHHDTTVSRDRRLTSEAEVEDRAVQGTGFEEESSAFWAAAAEKSAFSPTVGKSAFSSPNMNAHDGTSVWCSEDNDDSFFQQVFDRNKQLLIQRGEDIEEVTLDSWLMEQQQGCSKARLENWLEVHNRDRSGEVHSRDRSEAAVKGAGSSGKVGQASIEDFFVDDHVGKLEQGNGRRNFAGVGDSEDKDDNGSEKITPRSEGKDGRLEKITPRIEEKDDGSEKIIPRSEGKDDRSEETTPRGESAGGSDEITRLQLESWSEHGSEEPVKDRQNHGWEHNAEVASDETEAANDERTPRNLWNRKLDKRSHQVNEISDGVENIHLQSSETYFAKERETPRSLLSKVELLDSQVLQSGDGLATSVHSLTTSKTGQPIHPSHTSSSAVSGNPKMLSTLPSDLATEKDLYPFTLELSGSHEQYQLEGAQRGIQMLHNVDLESSSSSHPHSEASHGSRTSVHSQNIHQQGSDPRFQMSHNSRTSTHLHHLENGQGLAGFQVTKVSDGFEQNRKVRPGIDSKNSAVTSDLLNSRSQNELVDNFHELNTESSLRNNNFVNSLSQVDALTPSNTGNKSDAAYLNEDVPGLQAADEVVVNGIHMISGELMPEDERHGLDGKGSTENNLPDNVPDLPNFFMPEKDMQASIIALKLATAAAADVDKDALRAEGKVKAVSALVNRMTTTKARPASVSVRSKQPPSAEEAKRIARIFSTKMS